MNFSRTSIGQRIAGLGGILLLICLFLPWFGEDGLILSGWEGQSSTDVYLLITALIALAAAFAGPKGLLVPGLSMNGAATLLGGVGTILLLWLVLIDGDDRQYGMYLSLVAVIAITVGAYLAAQVEGDVARGIAPQRERPSQRRAQPPSSASAAATRSARSYGPGITNASIPATSRPGTKPWPGNLPARTVADFL